MMPGFFLVLDGVDGAGKSTQVVRLAERLSHAGHAVLTCRDPGGTPAGDRMRALLLDPEAALTPLAESLLYMASRAQLLHEIIRPALAAGSIVVCDRFVTSTLVYQGHAGRLELEALRRQTVAATEGLLPDLTLIFDVPLAVSEVRRQRPADRMEAKGGEFLDTVRAGFLAEARRDPQRFRIIDARGGMDEVTESAWREVSRALASRSRA